MGPKNSATAVHGSTRPGRADSGDARSAAVAASARRTAEPGGRVSACPASQASARHPTRSETEP
jgi:hypothetical protein